MKTEIINRSAVPNGRRPKDQEFRAALLAVAERPDQALRISFASNREAVSGRLRILKAIRDLDLGATLATRRGGDHADTIYVIHRKSEDTLRGGLTGVWSVLQKAPDSL